MSEPLAISQGTARSKSSTRRLLPFVIVFVLALATGTGPWAQSAQPAVQMASAPAVYRILITNDDGVRAPGILAVAQALKAVGEVTVVAPAEDQSGKSHSQTPDPLVASPVMLEGGIQAFGVPASPVTSMKVGVALMGQIPNLVVSGINRGYNYGMVSYPSGTVGAAREAALMGVPAIAASLGIATPTPGTAPKPPDYTAAAVIVRQVVEMARKNGVEPGVFLNVNIPPGDAAAIKGIQITRQSTVWSDQRFEEQKSPGGRRAFWLTRPAPRPPGAPAPPRRVEPDGTDVWATEQGYAAVTPLRVGEFDAKTYDAWRSVAK